MITLNRILVATDFSEPSDAALTYGRGWPSASAPRCTSCTSPTTFTSRPTGGNTTSPWCPMCRRRMADDARRRLDEASPTVTSQGHRTVPVVLTAASTAMAIVEYARVQDIDLIVIGTHGRGALVHLVMGSVAERVVRLAPCPVLTVRQPEREFVRPDTLAAVAGA